MRTGTVLSVMLHGALVALAFLSWPKEPLEPPQELNTVDVEMVTIADETNVMAATEAAPEAPQPAPPPPAAAPPPPVAEPTEAAPPPPRPPEPPRERQAALPPKSEPRPQTRTKPEPKPKPEPKKPDPPPKPEPKKQDAKKPEPKKPEPPKREEAKKPEPKKPEPPKQEEAKKPEPQKPEPKTPEKKQPDKPTQTAAAEPKKPEKKPEKPKPKKDEFNLDDIGAAADKLAKTPDAKSEEPPVKPPASGPRSAAGRGTKMTSTEIDVLRSTISQCWNVPAGAPNPETLVVRLKLFLNQDGTVARRPELLDTAGRAATDPYFRAAAEAAIRAVQVCAPYSLPQDKYDDWSEVTINFRPPF